MAKTKAQLEQAIENSKKDIASAQKEMEAADRKENMDKAAKELYDQFKSFKDAGFSADQAWELTRIIVSNGTKPKSLF